MSFSKNDLESIKNKILLSTEIEKKTTLTKKGNDFWCCCLFHKEKTPSFKINDDNRSFYCFGCGVKGDIFTIYTDLYNYSFQDAVKELAKRAGINIKFSDYKQNRKDKSISEILNLSCQWFQNNLNNEKESQCKKYLINRKLSQDTIVNFKLGYSYNTKITLFNFLKNQSFSEEDIIKSNVVKVDKNNKIKDYFYKRLIFPIYNDNNYIVGFGGRSLDNSNPKYINSPESNFFQKRNLLYNLANAKLVARKKNNILICEGYMDVISLYQNGIKSVVSPLGTALTSEQLNLAWKYSSKPTIMFDGDIAGLRASFKSALMSLPLISNKKFLQFITLPKGYDPDSIINSLSFRKLLEIIKQPQSLVNFVFNESSKTVSLSNVDEKISFDRYLDDIVANIKDKKTQYFYKKEFKSLFFQRIKNNRNNYNKLHNPKKIQSSLNKKQILSFIAASINHKAERKNIIAELLNTELFDNNSRDLLNELIKPLLIKEKGEQIIKLLTHPIQKQIVNDSLNSSIYELFPYSSPEYDEKKSLDEIVKSSQNLNTRLLKLKKINKSLDKFVENSSQLNWDELQSINMELSYED